MVMTSRMTGYHLVRRQSAVFGDLFEIERYDLETGEVSTAASGVGGSVRPTPSPDGRKIAFVRRERARSKLYVKDLVSGEERKIYDALDQDVQETWAVTGVYPNMAWTPDSAVGTIFRAPGDYPAGKEGDVLTVEFTVVGIPCLGLNGGPAFKHSEAFSFQIATDDQAETDRLWNAIVGNGGQESACGWCKDRWGLSWQITPRALTATVMGPDRAAAKRAFDAMMTMKKIDIAAIEAARRG